MTDSVARAAAQPVASRVYPISTQPNTLALEDDDSDLTALPPRRSVPALTRILFVAIIATLAFGGGVLVQKQHDATLTSAASVPSFSGLLGGGGPPGLGGATSSSAPVSGSTSETPVLVGTVVSVSGSDLTVMDLGGTSHPVHAAATTTISLVATDWSGSLKVGATVSIQGTKAADGSVTATAVTQR
jgi:hypothetical protein